MDLQDYIKSFVDGGLAGICGKTVVAPLDRIKYIFITSSRKFTYKEAWAEAGDIVTSTGFFRLWRGNLFNILRAFPYAAIVTLLAI